MRDTVDKQKCVVVFGIKERIVPIRHEREKLERYITKQVVKEAEDK